jgi:hypothetical protein
VILCMGRAKGVSQGLAPFVRFDSCGYVVGGINAAGFDIENAQPSIWTSTKKDYFGRQIYFRDPDGYRGQKGSVKNGAKLSWLCDDYDFG